MRRIGIYSGLVVDDNDQEEMRFRVRVRVNGIHHEDTPVDGIPWAEVMAQGASPSMGGSGDFRPYRKGDKVFIMFINGNEYLPVVTGAQITKRSGVPSIPLSAITDYVKGLLRWIRSDRAGNSIELSEASGEKHVLLRSGAAEVKVSSIGDVITVKSVHGKIRVEGGMVEVYAGSSLVRASSVTIDAAGEDLAGLPSGTATMRSNRTVDIVTDNPLSPGGIPTPASADEINIGGKIDTLKGVAIPPPTGKPPIQTAKNNLRSQAINIGVGLGSDPLVDYAGLPPIPLPPTLTINIRAALGVAIKTSGICSIDSVGPTTVTAGALTLTSVSVLNINAAAALTIQSAGPVILGSVSALTIQASALAFLTTPLAPPIITPPVP